jgi:hypothetical protein
MNLLLKILLMRRSRDGNRRSTKGDRGFAIPIVIALGLIMVVLSIASIYKSSDQNISATTQRGTSKALAAAEAGVAYYMAFLNRNSAIASYAFSRITANNQWTNGNLDPLDTCDISADIINTANNWRSAGTDGSYQLISYSYLSAGGVVPPAGTVPNNDTYGELTVLGTGSFSGNSFASTRVKVQLPIRPEMIGSSYSTSSYALNPVVWVGSYSATNDFGNLKVSYPSTGVSYGGNIVVATNTATNPCILANTLSTSTVATLQDATKQYIVADPRGLPTTPDLPANSYTTTSATLTGEIPNSILNGSLPKDINDRVPSQSKGTDDYYRFIIQGDLRLGSFSYTNDPDPTKRPKIILYVQGNIIVDDSTNITSNNSSSYLEIYGNTQRADGTWRYGGTGTNFISFTNANPITNLKAFIHAPDATVKYTGSGTVSYTGSIWAKNWDAAGLNITVTPDLVPSTSTGTGFSYQSSQFYTTSASPFVTGKPKIFPPIKWETEEVP